MAVMFWMAASQTDTVRLSNRGILYLVVLPLSFQGSNCKNSYADGDSAPSISNVTIQHSAGGQQSLYALQCKSRFGVWTFCKLRQAVQGLMTSVGLGMTHPGCC